MTFYRDYREHEIHLREDREEGDSRCFWWIRGFGKERENGVAQTRLQAIEAACSAIDSIQDDPYRFPVNLIGYPEALGGDVATRQGEYLGRWRQAGDEALEFVEFVPDGTTEPLFREHWVGLLCTRIREFHEGRENDED